MEENKMEREGDRVENKNAWHYRVKIKDRLCKVCNTKKVGQDGVLCTDCFMKLQTHYVKICMVCKNYEFTEWTPENVRELAKDFAVPYETLYHHDKIVILPCSACPKCMVY